MVGEVACVVGPVAWLLSEVACVVGPVAWLLLIGLGGAGVLAVAGATGEAAAALVCRGVTMWPVAVGELPV